MERASIDTAEKVVDEIKARFKAHKKKTLEHQTEEDKKRRAKRKRKAGAERS